MSPRRLPHMYLVLGSVLAVLTLVSAGCGEQLYSSCQLDGDNDCRYEDNVSCVETRNFQCEQRICARYRGSKAFCTQRCESDSECRSGKCKEFPFQAGTKFCVHSKNLS